MRNRSHHRRQPAARPGRRLPAHSENPVHSAGQVPSFERDGLLHSIRFRTEGFLSQPLRAHRRLSAEQAAGRGPVVRPGQMRRARSARLGGGR